MGWSATYRKQRALSADTVDTVDTMAPAVVLAPHCVHSVNCVTALETQIEGGGATASPSHCVNSVHSVTPEESRESDSEHIAAEPAFPEPGTPERCRLDQQQAEVVAGLLAGFARHRLKSYEILYFPILDAACARSGDLPNQP